MNDKITVDKLTNVLRYRLYDDAKLAVVYFTLDLDKYELIISGETTASYKWPGPTKETFIELMLRCSPCYLIDKLCKEEEFNLDESIKKTIESIYKYYDEDDIEDLIDDIKNIECDTAEGFQLILKEVFDINNFSYYPEDYCEIVTNVPYWIQKSIEYFCKYIKPLLKEELNRQEEKK